MLMADDVIVPPVFPDNRDAILEVVLTAFSNADHDGHEEVDIVLATWERGATAVDLELVAVVDETVVGHVLGAWGDLGGRDVVAVAPLAVLPSHQGMNIGSSLMYELLYRAEAAALPLVVVLGEPNYYQRFGFEPSGPLGITYPPVGEGNPYFQVLRFEGYDEAYRGEFTYCWEQEGRR